MKENKVEEFLRKVDRPWGMSIQELEQLQKEVSVLKSYKDRYELAIVPSEYIISDKSIIRKYLLGGEEKLLTLKDMQDYLNMYASDCAGKHYAISVLKEQIKQLKSEQNKVAECTLVDGYNCSICGASQADIRKKYSNYCSNCGAKINEEKSDE